MNENSSTLTEETSSPKEKLIISLNKFFKFLPYIRSIMMCLV